MSDRVGDLGGAATHGLIVQDTRFVEHLVLSVDGDRLEPLGVEPIGPHAATFVTRRKPRDGLADSTLLVVRERYVGNGLVEDITLENLSRQTEEHTLVLTVTTDFANLFEVKEGRAAAARDVTSAAADGVVSHSTLHPAPRSVRVSGTGHPAADGTELRWQMVIPPRGRASISVRVEPFVDESPLATPYPDRGATRRQPPGGAARRVARPQPATALRGPALRRAARAPAPASWRACASPTRRTRTGSSSRRAPRGS